MLSIYTELNQTLVNLTTKFGEGGGRGEGGRNQILYIERIKLIHGDHKKW